MHPILAFLLFLGACILAAAAGGLSPPSDWYQSLVKPPLTPPGWVFGAVWSVLYLFIAIAGWLIWRAGNLGTIAPELARAALILWGIQLVFNAAWTPLFFGLQLPLPALIWIILLWGLILSCILCFSRIDRIAAWLFVPYLVWVSCATYLNAGFWWLNR